MIKIRYTELGELDQRRFWKIAAYAALHDNSLTQRHLHYVAASRTLHVIQRQNVLIHTR